MTNEYYEWISWMEELAWYEEQLAILDYLENEL